ncbi:hypothetical protein D6779_05515 [Candidatus Parcubacteria bacterium]|nr:MAG: hypothetical protein D6779_05515 [Candidatus Parcubacteria bacterium]
MGTILVLISRSLSRISDEEASPQKGSFLDRLLSSGIPERIDAFLNILFFKIIKRAKIIVMRMDNFLGTQLKRVQQHNRSNQNIHPHFLKNLKK